MNSRTGNFISADPAGIFADPLAEGNPFMFAARNPIAFFDATGFASDENGLLGIHMTQPRPS